MEHPEGILNPNESLGMNSCTSDARFSTLSNCAGFTLVELMVVVSITGILASIALSNYHNFVARSRQTEAKILLSSAYIAETSFFSDQTSFTTCLPVAGFDRTGERYFYSIGFSASPAACGGDGATDCHSSSFHPPTSCPQGTFPAGGYFPATQSASGVSMTRATFNASITNSITTQAFRISAVGRVSARGPTVIDVWSINETKRLVNDRIGL
jgi:prepilin-type N-terminal cleavage/methylation domain-containing protein